ncbi:alpha-L-rhamnosidase [Parabacteroides pacaensis]|uniref:alpha-L-rhamnosidase n=1 Tax=Parabacteroides pacaensis TaxID=2086575 RepID=UPI000D0F7183|nr:alpha-L-rhamnosidase [Parabacteroides pacaensis]
MEGCISGRETQEAELKTDKYSQELSDAAAWNACWIGINDSVKLIEDETRLPARYLRKEFTLDNKIKQARLYICGLGAALCYLNGQPLTKDALIHPLTMFSKNLYYNTYDVTNRIQKGINVIGVILGNGRYQTLGAKTLRGVAVPQLLLRLDIEQRDGSRKQIVSDLSWKGTVQGPIIAKNVYDGEEYDARLELGNWLQPGYGDSCWQSVDSFPSPGGQLTAKTMGDIKVMEEIKPVAIKSVADGKYLLDMGQNMVGWLQVKLQGKKNVPVVLRFAEILKNNGTEIDTGNLRAARATDMYIPSRDGLFSWEPRFVYHGFRYVEITGLDEQPAPEDFIGKVSYDEMETIGSFLTSDTLINRIYQNAYWTIRGNYQGMPVDCPQRDERQGWLGDRVGTMRGESFIFHNARLYKKWMQDIEDSMSEEGRISVVSPRTWTIYADDAAWSSAYFYIADMLYTQFGDIYPIKKFYPSMKRWVNYMKEKRLKDYLLPNDEFGDWCMPPESPELIHSLDPARKTNGTVINTTIFYDLLRLMEKFAVLNDSQTDAQQYALLAAKVKDAYNKKFFRYKTAQYDNNTVTANLLSLQLGLVPEGYETNVFNNIVKKIEDDNGHISSGIVGMRYLMQGLTAHGGGELAYRIATNSTYPSWGYMVKKGATTIWELWNGDTADPAMNSANHVMLLGDLIAWFYEDLAGIKNAPASVGFKQLRMEPVFPEQLSFVKASYKSPYGTIKSEWQKNGNYLSWQITIPSNTSAVICVPSRFKVHIKHKGGIIKKGRIMSEKEEKGKHTIELKSGKYWLVSGD